MRIAGGHLNTLLVEDTARQSERVATWLDGLAARPAPLLFGTQRSASRIEQGLRVFGDEIREAVQLLDGMPASAARDALRGTMLPLLDPAAMAAGGQTAIHAARSRINDQVDSLRAWGDIAHLDDAARAIELDRIRRTGIDGLDAVDWRRLGAILEDDVAHQLEPALPRTLGGQGRELHRLAIDVGSGRPASTNVASPWFIGRRYFDAWDATQLTPDERIATVQRILAADPSTVSRSDWRLVAGILHVQPDAAYSVADRTLSVMRISEAASAAGSGGRFLDRALDGVPSLDLPPLDAAARRQVAEELLGTGPIGDVARRVVDADRLDVVGLDGDAAILARIRHQQPTTRAVAERWLEDTSRWLARAQPKSGLEPIRDTALDLADRNLRRMDGSFTRDTRPGWREPDYAELGRVQSLVQMLEAAGRSTPPAEASRAASGSGSLVW